MKVLVTRRSFTELLKVFFLLLLSVFKTSAWMEVQEVLIFCTWFLYKKKYSLTSFEFAWKKFAHLKEDLQLVESLGQTVGLRCQLRPITYLKGMVHLTQYMASDDDFGPPSRVMMVRQPFCAKNMQTSNFFVCKIQFRPHSSIFETEPSIIVIQQNRKTI